MYSNILENQIKRINSFLDNEFIIASVWEYFFTLTFDLNKLDSSNYDLLSNKVHNWINNTRSFYAPDLRYIIVPELHKDGIHYYFHGFLSHIGNMSLKDSGIVRNGRKIYNFENWKYGFSTVSKFVDTECLNM